MKHLSWLVGIALTVVANMATASPGAHGPNGEHLDVMAPSSGAAGTRPRAEAFSETYELVARLDSDALALELVRYESNEPVVNAKIDVENGAARAPAVFEPTSGSYRVTDAAFLQVLRAQGSHALMFTITAGQDADLLKANLGVPSAQKTAVSVIPASAWPVAASALFVGIVVLYGRRWKGRKA